MIDKRISYYTRKVAEYGKVPILKRNCYRYERLLLYKKLLNATIEDRL